MAKSTRRADRTPAGRHLAKRDADTSPSVGSCRPTHDQPRSGQTRRDRSGVGRRRGSARGVGCARVSDAGHPQSRSAFPSSCPHGWLRWPSSSWRPMRRWAASSPRITTEARRSPGYLVTPRQRAFRVRLGRVRVDAAPRPAQPRCSRPRSRAVPTSPAPRASRRRRCAGRRSRSPSSRGCDGRPAAAHDLVGVLPVAVLELPLAAWCRAARQHPGRSRRKPGRGTSDWVGSAPAQERGRHQRRPWTTCCDWLSPWS